MGRRPNPVPQGFTPNRLLNVLFEKLDVETDRALADVLGIAASHISFFRRGVRAFSAGFFMAVLDAIPTMTLAELRRLSGMPKGWE